MFTEYERKRIGDESFIVYDNHEGEDMPDSLLCLIQTCEMLLPGNARPVLDFGDEASTKLGSLPPVPGLAHGLCCCRISV